LHFQFSLELYEGAGLDPERLFAINASREEECRGDQRQQQQNAPVNAERRAWRASARHRQQQQVAVRGLLIERPESSNNRAEKGVDTGILYSINQWMCFCWKKQKSRTGQRALAATATTRDFDVDSFHL
jgi:hypothetical protein